MERIRFKSADDHQRVFAKVLNERVNTYFRENKLSKKGNLSLYFKSALMLLAYIAPFVVLLTADLPILAAVLLVVLIGIGKAGVGMCVMHDGAHGAYSNKKWANKMAASSMALLGSTVFNWHIQHNVRHHTYTNIFEHDEDIATKGIIRLCEHAPLKRYHRFQHFYSIPLYGLMTLLRFFGEIVTLIDYNKTGVTAGRNAKPHLEVIKLLLTKVIYLGVAIGLPLLLTDYSIWQIFAGFALWHIIAGMIMSIVFQLAHVVEETHQPEPGELESEPCNWAVHQLRTTSDFGRKNGLLSWYIGGLDFQIEHHLFQSISHVHYPAIAPIVESTAREFGFHYNLNSSIRQAFVSHYIRLKALGRVRVG